MRLRPHLPRLGGWAARLHGQVSRPAKSRAACQPAASPRPAAPGSSSSAVPGAPHRPGRRAAGWLRRRERGTDLVEYGLLAASLAFVGVAGLNVLSTSERNYFEHLPLNPAPPSAPGELLHPTGFLAAAPVCNPRVIPIGATIMCTVPPVFDTFSNATDRNPPWGTIYLEIGSQKVFVCTLPPIPGPGASNACPPVQVPVHVTDPNLARTQSSVVAVFEAPTSNHVPSPPSPPSPPIQINPPIHTVCSNLVEPGLGSGVAIGHPLTCTTTITNPNTGAPASGVAVDWKADSGGNGDPLFTCSTNNAGSTLQNTTWNPACAPAAHGSFCTTDPAGQCSVVYRRLPGPTSLGAGGLDRLTVSVNPYGVNTFVTVSTPTDQHPTAVWMNCQSSSASIAQGTLTLQPPRWANPTFTAATDISAHHGDSVTCTATVIDAGSNTALDCKAGSPPTCASTASDPDRHAAWPPLGTVTWTWPGMPTSAPPSCQLTRYNQPIAGLPPPQPSGMTPFASTCSILLDLSSATSGQLTVSYSGAGVDPGHQPVQNSIPLTISS